MTLVEFLLARLAEKERLAQRAAELCGCHPPAPSWDFGDESTGGRIVVVDEPHPQIKRKLNRRWNGTYVDLFHAEHIVQHDPARVLAEIDIKRRIIELHTGNHECSVYEDHGRGVEINNCAWIEDKDCSTLHLLALPDAGHPDYREEWRPQEPAA